MKFHVEVALEQAREAELETRSLQLSTPRGVAVTLPPVIPAG
jgi:hypothetical protein